MMVAEKIWKDTELDLYDKLIVGLLDEDSAKTPSEIAAELQTSVTRVNRKINRMTKEGRLAIIIAKGTRRVEVQHG